ncbi:MAG: flagellar basal body P-ring protein FlgI [Planctomycetes bacterium]|nr:flagellar basal body P-ring protein FlgI [Planctomycetota bacterium]
MRSNATLASILALAGMLILAPAARGVTVGDVTEVEGQRINKLHGLGLVVGLKGTGDSGEYMPTIRPLMALLSKLSDPVVSVEELEETRNVAVVTVTCTIPKSGAREGDRLDVQVQSIGSCKSLKGGRLFIAPLQGPQRNSIVYALAEGAVRIEDPQVPTCGVVDGGAVIEEAVVTDFVNENRFRLVLNEANSEFSWATTIADTINQHTEYEVGSLIARALDAKTIEVTIPEAYQKNPTSFISRIQRLDLILPYSKARVEINEKTGTIVITGNVEISPAVVSHKQLLVSTEVVAAPVAQSSTTGAAAAATTASYVPAEGHFFDIDPRSEGGVQLRDLVTALNVLKVPAEDRIAIIKLLAKAGRVHAEVVFAE